MRAERPLTADWRLRLQRLGEDWGHDPDLAAVYLFGSRAGEAFSPRSDIDLAVILHRRMDAGARLRKRLGLLGDAATRLATDAVDLIVLEDAPSVLAHRALKHGRLLMEIDPARRVEMVEDVYRRYLDEACLRDELDRGLAARVRTGQFAR